VNSTGAHAHTTISNDMETNQITEESGTNIMSSSNIDNYGNTVNGTMLLKKQV